LPYACRAGLAAGVLFALAPTKHGPRNTGERDEVMAVLIVVGYAFLFEALRRKKPWLMALFGLSLGMAGAVKPTVAPLEIALLVMAWWTLRKRGEATAAYVWSGIAGASIAVAIFFGFLFRYHALSAFVDISRRLTPYYAGLNHSSFKWLLRTCLAAAVKLMLPFGLLVSLVNRQWKNWERWAILLGVAFGMVSFFVQGKGYSHHRYPLNALILLWLAIELTTAMQKRGWVRAVGFAGMAVGTFVIVPWHSRQILSVHPVNEYTESIESDLTRLGVDQLQGKVQCFDLVHGCLNALYHLKLVQSTGSTGDLLLFAPVQTTVTQYYRNQFWGDLSRNPPSVIVMSNEWWITGADSFAKINAWPQFAEYLEGNYSLAVSREFDGENQEAYRIYIRKGIVLPLG